MMTDYYEKSIKALQLAGMNERTQECYTRAIRKLVDFYLHQKTWQQPDPDHVTGCFEVHPQVSPARPAIGIYDQRINLA